LSGVFYVQDGRAQSSPGESWYPEILKQETGGEIRLQQQVERAPYLPDFSFAGYRWGEEDLPEPQGEVIDVTDFGAVPDDGNDDTRAIRDAMRAAHRDENPVIVQFPPGRFIAREILFVERSDFVLQGSGRGERGTELHFPRPLMEMETPGAYEDPIGRDFSPFSWRGGVIWVRNVDAPKQKEIARLVAGRRGQHTIKTEHPTGLQPGDVVQIQWYNREGKDSSLLYHIYCATDVSFGKNLYKRPDRPVVTQEVTVQQVRGATISIKEPLLHDLRREWAPTLNTVHFLENVGIEQLRITFPDDVEYAGHHQEEGYNGIYLNDILHSWVRDVAIENADSGILSNSSKNFTLKRIAAGVGRWGHYSVHLANAYGALVTDFELYPTLHNPSFNTFSRGSVYSDGFILNPVLDQHMGVNHQNLFDNLRTRYNRPDDRLFVFGGSKTRWGPVAGAFNTFWNIQVDIRKTSAPVSMRGVKEAPRARLVGVRGVSVPIDFEYGPHAHIEGTNKPGLAIPSLYTYQLEKRLAGEKRPSLAIYNPLDGYRFEEGESVPVEAEISGDFTAASVRFIADGREVGTDTDGSDGWSIVWENPTRGFHTIFAVARDSQGNTLTARPLSCTGEHVSIWVGGDEGILKGNYPNPFREKTTIQYTLPRMQRVRLEIYDIMGRKVRTLLDDVQRAGENQVEFDAGRLASGSYFYHIDAQYFRKTGRVTLVR
jgi:hypothetical protein